jgi:molybdenum cofactor guanylyltransferase
MSKPVRNEISGIVLAGGKSSRMGTDKALLIFDNQTLLQRMVNLMDAFCQKIYVSGQNSDYLIGEVELIPDKISDCGPIAGLFSSLSASKTDWNLVISVDVPIVNQELLTHIISNADSCDCVVPKHDDRIEPSIAMYHRSCLPMIQEMINTGDFKLQNLVSKLNTKYLNCDELLLKYPRMFLNVNRMEDFRAL